MAEEPTLESTQEDRGDTSRIPTQMQTPEAREKRTRGKAEHSAVDAYLEWLSAPKPPRKMTVERIEEELSRIDAELESLTAVKQLLARQERRRLENNLDLLKNSGAIKEQVEQAFIEAARGFHDRHQLDYATWVEQGVSASVLARAGISKKR